MKKQSYLKSAITGLVAGSALMVSGCLSDSDSSSEGNTEIETLQAAYTKACNDAAADGWTLNTSSCNGQNGCAGALDGEKGTLTATCQGSATCEGTLHCVCEDDTKPCADAAENPGAAAVKG